MRCVYDKRCFVSSWFSFRTIWQLFTSWEIPGTHVSPAEWAFFVLGSVLSIKVIKRIMLEDYNDERRGD